MLKFKRRLLSLVFIALLFSMRVSAAVYQDDNGLVVMEAENLTGATSLWLRETSFTPYSGASYIRWSGADQFSNPGTGVISTTIKINNPGTYRIQFRNKVGHGTSATEANDTWMKFPGVTQFYGEKDGEKVYPKGSGLTPNPEGASKDGWLKVYSNGTTAWTWRTNTNDNDAHFIYVEFATAGEYNFSLSGRSQHHCVDRIVLYKSTVTEAYATSLDRTETLVSTAVTPVSRIAVLADGNSPDPDDIGGTAVSLAIIRSLGAEDRLVYYAHSCDLVRNNTKISAAMEVERQALMQTACDSTAGKWGGFEHVTFYNCRTQQTLATEKLRDAINASTESSPLAIVEAGEPDVIYDAIAAAESDKLQYVSIITHHIANDDSADDPNKKLSNILADFPTVTEDRITDQNVNLQQPIATWDWARDHADSRITWLYSQGKIAEQDTVVGFQSGKFDCSDAGMVYYHLTGEKLPTVAMLQTLFTTYVGGDETPAVDKLSDKVSLHISFEDEMLANWETDGADYGVTPAIIDGINTRAGSKVMALEFTANSSGHHVQNIADKIVVPNNHYFHMIAYTATDEVAAGYSIPTAKLGDWAPTPSFTVNTENDTFERKITSRQNTKGDSLNCYPRLRSKAQGAACVVYYDDIVLYTSESATADIVAPTAAHNLTLDNNKLSWTEGTDTLTGVQATLVLRTSNATAEAPVLYAQAAYATPDDATSISVIGDWSVIASLPSGTTTYTDGTATANDRYAVVHRDLAYNYSAPLVYSAELSALNEQLQLSFRCVGVNGGVDFYNLPVGSELTIYSINGVKVFAQSLVSSTLSLPLSAGLYIVKVDNEITKVIVR